MQLAVDAAAHSMHADFMGEAVPAKVEDSDPVCAEILRQIANREHPTVKGLYISPAGVHVVRHPVKVQTTGRNDPCSCGSGKKYKKCCG